MRGFIRAFPARFIALQLAGVTVASKLRAVEYRSLGRTGVPVSAACYGTMTFRPVRRLPSRLVENKLTQPFMRGGAKP